MRSTTKLAVSWSTLSCLALVGGCAARGKGETPSHVRRIHYDGLELDDKISCFGCTEVAGAR
jgi:hypothetical protein